MKYVLIIGDGMADVGIDALGGETPLSYLDLPGMRRLAGGEVGRARTCPEGMPPGSDVAFLSIFGNDPADVYTGRSPLEAAGSGVVLGEGDVSFRMNLVAVSGDDFDAANMLSHNGGGIEGADALALVHALLADPAFARLAGDMGLSISPTDTFRHIAVMPGDDSPFVMTPPHDIVGQPIGEHLPTGQAQEAIRALTRRAFEVLCAHPVNAARRAAGKLPANGIWLWGAGTLAKLHPFEERFGHSGVVVSAVPLVKGIARLCGLTAPDVPGATGLLDTNYRGKVDCALDALRAGDDFACIHLEAPDELSHDGDVKGKLSAMCRLDERIIEPVLSALPGIDPDFRILLMPDHYTLLSTRTHDATPVPYCVYDSRDPGTPRTFSEQLAARHDVMEDGYNVLSRLFAG